MSKLLQYLADVHARGLRVVEHPDYGGVHPVHVAGSMHYKGRAGDINYGLMGAPPEERPVLLWASRLADAAGLNVIYAYHRTHPIKKTNDNHRDHLHVDDGPIAAYVPPGRNDALYARILAERPVLVSNVSPSAPSAPPVDFNSITVDPLHPIQEAEMFIVMCAVSGDRNKGVGWVVVPQGAGKPRATSISGLEDRSGIPTITFKDAGAWQRFQPGIQWA